ALIGPAPSRAQRQALARFPNAVLEARPYRLEWMPGASADRAESRAWLGELARRHRADLVHVNGYADARLDCRGPVLAVAHSDVLSWWLAVHGAPAPAEWDAYRDAAIAGLAAADRVAAPTRAALDDLRRNFGVPLDRAEAIPNGIDVSAYAP